MGSRKKEKKTITSNSLINTQALDLSIENLLRDARDGIIAFNMQGNIIAINKPAAQLLGKKPEKLINQFLWEQIKLNTFSRKRQFIHARKNFMLAMNGIAQQFSWIERNAQKPILAFNITINKAEIEGNTVFFAKLNDILQAEIIEWVLWCLAKISNHHEISEVIDDILKLVINQAD